MAPDREPRHQAGDRGPPPAGPRLDLAFVMVVVVGHRALVAYERGADEYALHYSHWGAAGLVLARTIAPSTPFGGYDPDARVDPEPRATGLSLDEVVADHLDFQVYEAFYVVDGEGLVTAYLPLWLGLADVCRAVEDSETVGNGVLVPVRGPGVDPADPGWTRKWFRGTKGTAGLLVDRGRLARGEATSLLVERVRERLPGREVVVATPD